jgi:hypothetical protein
MIIGKTKKVNRRCLGESIFEPNFTTHNTDNLRHGTLDGSWALAGSFFFRRLGVVDLGPTSLFRTLFISNYKIFQES